MKIVEKISNYRKLQVLASIIGVIFIAALAAVTTDRDNRPNALPPPPDKTVDLIDEPPVIPISSPDIVIDRVAPTITKPPPPKIVKPPKPIIIVDPPRPPKPPEPDDLPTQIEKIVKKTIDTITDLLP